jgi:2-polyprenyl-3-methyl-5-hydroxy-6-metoxy-1,4-benzoquinol methylase
MEWIERALCPLCDSKRRKFLLEKEGGIYVRCDHCGLVYTSPAKSAENLQRIADEWAVKHHASSEKIAWEGNEHMWEIVYGPRMNRLDRYRGNGRILDVGCSTGDFLACAKSRGWKVHGVELSKHTSNIARKSLDCEIRHGTFESSNFEAEYFDVVTMWDVVEHVLEPRAIVKEAFRVLRPEGALVLFTPNYDALTRRLIFDRWSALTPENHMCVFNKSTITRLLNECGGEVVFMRVSDINPYEIFHGTRNESKENLKNRQISMGKIKGLLIKYPLLQYCRELINVLLNITGAGDVIEIHAIRPASNIAKK